MKIIQNNMWNLDVEYKVITTNGIVKANGELVMGAGIALQAKTKYVDLPQILGGYVKQYGNRCFIVPKYKIISFPTKNDWRDKSDINLIKKSCLELKEIIIKYNIKGVALPMPGCGNGGLTPEEVGPILEEYLGDLKERLLVVAY